ncbi:MAG: hypothetical protein BMS9Abin05_1277 [Rhodothermia bacterium]|nr:MAG: hypothetical protein BMS9Abin05_1277 [Rhodothermia bacterium]
MKGRSTYRFRRVLAGFFFALLVSGSTVDAYAQRPIRARRSVRPPELHVQFHRAETAWKSGNSLLEAKARIDRVIKELPDDLEARKLRAGILLTMGKADQAFLDAQRAVRLGPDDGEAQLLLCETSVRTQHEKSGLAALKRSADLLMDQHDLHIRLSKCAVSLERLDEAEAYARIALAGDATNSEAYLQLARVFANVNQDENAITVLRQGLTKGIVKPEQLQNEQLFKKLLSDTRLDEFLRDR